MHSIKLDWYRASMPFANKDDALALVERYGDRLRDETKGWWNYETKVVGATKSSLHYSRGVLGGRARPECCLDLNGTFMGGLDADGQLGLLRELGVLGPSESRLDVAFDDYDWVVTPAEVDAAYDAGCVVGFRNADPRGKKKRPGQDTGKSVAFGAQGSQGSGKYLLVYDKNEESKGAINACRWEFRFFGERAEQAGVYLRLATSAGDLLSRLGSLIVGGIDFRNRELDPDNINRCPRLPWWQKLCGKLGQPHRVVVRKEDRTLEEMRDYAANTWPRRLALMYAWYEKHHPGYGFQMWMDQLRFAGDQVLTDVERRLVEASSAPDLDLPF